MVDLSQLGPLDTWHDLGCLVMQVNGHGFGMKGDVARPPKKDAMPIPGGGFHYFLLSPLLEEMIQFD